MDYTLLSSMDTRAIFIKRLHKSLSGQLFRRLCGVFTFLPGRLCVLCVWYPTSGVVPARFFVWGPMCAVVLYSGDHLRGVVHALSYVWRRICAILHGRLFCISSC